ncbi:MAG: UDP-2,4-diacetamido-2,4,6-trideoxy-beta-L-altropyranose hydrolase [Glaciecola sp.]|jgi:UDP-2,4-diacetamido-2,4,6-trideoxy-beta-L-altropyranose hydrolase
MIQLFFRVEGNEHIGLGHLMRCFALSQAARRAHIDVVFICNQASKEFLLSRHQWQGQIVVINDSRWNDTTALDAVNERNNRDIDFIAKCMLEFSSKESPKNRQMLVLDGYQFDHSYQNVLFKSKILFAYLDDINTFLQNNKNHEADIIINGAGAAKQLGYEKNAPNSIQCLGPQYLLLRPEFMNLPLIPIVERHSLLICFGGADAQNYTVKMLCALSQLKFQHPVRVVTGAAYKGQKNLMECIQDGWLAYENVRQQISMPIQYIHDAQDMSDIMLHSRLSVSAAGGTQFELMRCYTPSFLVVVADNQMPAALQSSKEGWCCTSDWRHKSDYIGLAKQIIIEYDDTDSLMAKQQKAYKCLQPDAHSGANNVLDVFKDLLNSRC